MAVNTQTIRVDLNTGKEIPVAFAHQKDTNRQLTFTLYNKGQPYSPSGMTAKFAYRSPTVNGEYSVITGSEMPSGTILANTVTVTLTEKMTSVAGMGLLTMILSSSGNTLRPVNIKLLVQGSADGDDQVLFASDWPDGLYDYMDNWLEENEPTEIANLKSDLSDNDVATKSMQELLGEGVIYKNNISHGSAVSVTTTKTVVNAEAGWDVKVNITDEANASKSFVFYVKYAEDESSTNITTVTQGTEYSFVSAKTLEYIGVYQTGLATGTTTITATVTNPNGIKQKVEGKVDITGLRQVTTDNLEDITSNILYKNSSVVVTGSKGYVSLSILTYSGSFVVGDKFNILCDSVTGASAASPYGIYLESASNEDIRQRQYADVEITQSDINSGLDHIVFLLYPAKGTQLPSGSAIYTNVRIIKGEKEEYSISGNLKNAVKTTISDDAENVPDYYFTDNYLSTKIERINQLAEQCAGNGDIFLFITDEHWDFGYNQKNAPTLIGYLSKKCNIPRLFDGGDSANGASLEFIDALHSNYSHDIHHIMGNHDWMLNRSGDYLAYHFDSFGYKQVGNTEKHYYYVDNDQKKIRYIILNAWKSDLSENNTLVSAYDTEQLNWFTGTALNVEVGWDVIIFTHYMKDGNSYAPDGALAFANTIDNYDGNGNIICVFEGHTHWDNISHTNGGVPVISTTCDKNGSWISDGTNMEPWLDEQRPDGTIYEQAFDVVCVNRTLRKITMVRIGALAMNNVDKTYGEADFSTEGTLEEREINY